MKEIEIIKKVRNNNEDAYLLIKQKYENMIHSIIHSFTLAYGDFKVQEDELFEEGCIAIYEACKTYNEMNGCKFSTYLYLIIKRKLSRELFKSIYIYKHEGLSFDRLDTNDKYKFFENKCVEENPIVYSDKRQKHDEMYKTFKELTPLDQRIIKLRLLNYSYEEIGRMLNVKKKKIDNRLQFIKKYRSFN